MSRSSRLLHIRSKPLSTLAAPPPPPLPSASARTPPRLPHEAPKQHHHHPQLALTSPTQALQPSLFPPSGGPALPPPFSLPSTPRQASQGTAAPAHADGEGDFALLSSQEGAARPREAKRPRLAYRLDAGAYGIPKTRPGGHTHPYADTAAYPTSIPSLAVQVGEDAYFLRENAMGVADGVGGWAVRAASSSAASASSSKPSASKPGGSSEAGSRSRSSCATAQGPTPSAMFARRLMHYCSAEIALLDERHGHVSRGTAFSTKNRTNGDGDEDGTTTSCTSAPSAAFSFAHPLKPPGSRATRIPEADPDPYETLQETLSELSLEETLEELSDGIDVLQILERAYDSTVRAHAPLTTGSSTALVAVLDAASPAPVSPPASQSGNGPTYASTSGSASGSTSTRISRSPLGGFTVHCSPGVEDNYAVGALWRETHGLHPSSSRWDEPRDGDTRDWGRDKTAQDESGMTGVTRGVNGIAPGLTGLSPAMTAGEDSGSAYAHHENDGVNGVGSKDGASRKADANEDSQEYDAVVHIVHVGDCMGMLVRGDAIAWRTDEMWWGYNYPLQLGPPQNVHGSGPAQGTPTSGSISAASRWTADTISTKFTTNAQSQSQSSHLYRQRSPTPAPRRGGARVTSPTGVHRAWYHTDAPGKSAAPGLSREADNPTTLPSAYTPIEKQNWTSTLNSTETTSMSTTSTLSSTSSTQTDIPTTTPGEEHTLIPPPVRAHTFTLPVRADDIIILASDGLADNLWDEDVLDEVVRVRGAMLGERSTDEELGTGKGSCQNEWNNCRKEKQYAGKSELSGRGQGAEVMGRGIGTMREAELAAVDMGTCGLMPRGVGLRGASAGATTRALVDLLSSSSFEPAPGSSSASVSQGPDYSVPHRSPYSSSSSSPFSMSSAGLAPAPAILQDVRPRRVTTPPLFTTESLSPSTSTPLGASAPSAQKQETGQVEEQRARRTAFARTLAEALCSRAKRVSERRGSRHCAGSGVKTKDKERVDCAASYAGSERIEGKEAPADADEVPFARRAKMAGRTFRGGKCDDISVLVAVVSPAGVPVPIA